jgi:hypothetical protein
MDQTTIHVFFPSFLLSFTHQLTYFVLYTAPAEAELVVPAAGVQQRSALVAPPALLSTILRFS